MIRTTLFVLLALIGITIGQNINGIDFYKCHSGKFVEYKRIPGTDKIGYFSNEKKTNEHLWSYDLLVSDPFIWDGAFASVIDNVYYPDAARFFSFHSVHREGGRDDSNVFPQSGNRTIGNVYNTNQLIVEDFEKHIDIKAGNSEPYTAPAQFPLFFGYYKNLLEFHYGMRIETENQYGYRRIFWAEGTQFQRYNAGKHRDCPLHNGHVVDSGCDLSEKVPNVEIPCSGDMMFYLVDPVYIGSGNPAIVPYLVPSVDETCSFTFRLPAKKRIDFEINIAFTWYGAGSDDSIVVTDQDGSVVASYEGGNEGYEVITVPSFEAKITFTKKNTTTFSPDQLVKGFRAIAYMKGLGQNCLELHQECENSNITECVVESVSDCADGWDEVCVAAADICKSKIESGVEFINPNLYEYPEEINNQFLQDNTCGTRKRCKRSTGNGLTGDILKHLNSKKK